MLLQSSISVAPTQLDSTGHSNNQGGTTGHTSTSAVTTLDLLLPAVLPHSPSIIVVHDPPAASPPPLTYFIVEVGGTSVQSAYCKIKQNVYCLICGVECGGVWSDKNMKTHIHSEVTRLDFSKAMAAVIANHLKVPVDHDSRLH
jgi:hypothetical protein